jgi:hypothetical protein
MEGPKDSTGNRGPISINLMSKESRLRNSPAALAGPAKFIFAQLQIITRHRRKLELTSTSGKICPRFNLSGMWPVYTRLTTPYPPTR